MTGKKHKHDKKTVGTHSSTNSFCSWLLFFALPLSFVRHAMDLFSESTYRRNNDAATQLQKQACVTCEIDASLQLDEVVGRFASKRTLSFQTDVEWALFPSAANIGQTKGKTKGKGKGKDKGKKGKDRDKEKSRQEAGFQAGDLVQFCIEWLALPDSAPIAVVALVTSKSVNATKDEYNSGDIPFGKIDKLQLLATYVPCTLR